MAIFRNTPSSLDAYLADLEPTPEGRRYRKGYPGVGSGFEETPLTVLVGESKPTAPAPTPTVVVQAEPRTSAAKKPYSRYGRYEGMQVDPEAMGAREGGLISRLTGWTGLAALGEAASPERAARRQNAEQRARAYNSQLEEWAREDSANEAAGEAASRAAQDREARRQYEWEVETGQKQDAQERQLAREGRLTELQELRNQRAQEAHDRKMRRGQGGGGSPRAAGGAHYDKALEAMERGDLAGMRAAAQEADAAKDYKTADKIRADIAAKIKIGDTTARTEKAAEERGQRADDKERKAAKRYFVEKTAPFRDLSAAIAELEPYLDQEDVPGAGQTGWAPRFFLGEEGKKVRNAQELIKETYGRAQSGAAIGAKEDKTFGSLSGIDWSTNMTDQELRDRVRLLKRWNEANINHFRAYDPDAAAEAEADFGGARATTYRVTSPDGATRDMSLTPQQAQQWAAKGGKVERVQ